MSCWLGARPATLKRCQWPKGGVQVIAWGGLYFRVRVCCPGRRLSVVKLGVRAERGGARVRKPLDEPQAATGAFSRAPRGRGVAVVYTEC